MASFILTLTRAVLECCLSYASYQRSFQGATKNGRSKLKYYSPLLIFIDAFGALMKNVCESFSGWWKKKSNILLFFDLISIYPRASTGEKKESLGNWYHPLCLKCKKCGRQLATGNHAEVSGFTALFSTVKSKIQFNTQPNTKTDSSLLFTSNIRCRDLNSTRNVRQSIKR